MSAVNVILEGKYKNEKIKFYSDYIYLSNVYTGKFTGRCPITKYQISSYQVLDENTKNSSEYSFWKGMLGVALFGDSGAVLGVGGKNKFSKEYLISIEWKSGEKSLILIDDEYYKAFIKGMF